MAKKRKTRKEKELSDKRHKHILKSMSSSPSEDTPVVSPTYTYSASTPLPSLKQSKTSQGITISYSYLKHDLLKTGIITTGILVAELVLFFSLNRM